MKKLFYTLLFLSIGTSIFGQMTVRGKMVDKASGTPLMFATINLKSNPKKGISTDENGDFQINVPENSTLVFSYVGFYTKEEKAIEYMFVEMEEEETPNPTIEISPIIITDTRIQYRQARPITRLNKKEIQLNTNVNIAPTLNRVPGIFMHSGALNTNRITIRGIGSRNLFGTAKLRAYLNGIPLTNGTGETSLEDIDLNTIDAIKIWKGPSASVYGAALGGVIDMQINTASKAEIALKNETTFGSFGLLQNTSGVHVSNEKTRTFAQYTRTHSDGYRENNEYDRQNITLFSNVKIDKNNELSILAQHIDLQAFIPSSLNADDYEDEPTKAAFTWGNVRGNEDVERTLIGLSHNYLADNWSWQNSLFNKQFQNYELRPFNILDEKSHSLGGRSVFYVEVFKWGNYTFGTEYLRENYTNSTYKVENRQAGDQLSNQAQIRQVANLFAEGELDRGNWTIEAGLNLNSTTYHLDDRFLADSIEQSGRYTFRPTLSPRVGVNYSFGYLSSIYALVSHGMNAPTIEETLTPDGNINPNIQPEKGWNFELGSRGKRDKWYYDIALYSMQINDLLVARRTDFDQFIGINAGKTIHNGVEIYTSYYLKEPTWRITASYAFSDYKFADFVDEDEDYSGNPLTGVAPHVVNIGSDWEFENGFFGTIQYRFVDAMPLRDDASVFSENYQIINAKFGYKCLFSNQLEAEFSIGANNLFDEKYASMVLINAGSFGGNAPRYYYPGLPRNYYGMFSLKYILK